MVFIKILQRKDATSVILAVALGLALAQFLSSVAIGLSNAFSLLINQDVAVAQAFDWRASLFQPAMLFVLQVVLLELLARVVVWFRRLVIKLKQHKK